MTTSSNSQTNLPEFDPVNEKLGRFGLNVLEGLKVLDLTGRVVNEAFDLTKVGRLIIENVIQAVEADSGHLLLHEQTPQLLKTLAAVNLPAPLENSLQLMQHSVLRRVAQTLQPDFICSLDDSPELEEDLHTLRSLKVEAFACLPLHVHEQLLGILFINYAEPHDFTEYEQQLLKNFANQAAAAIFSAKIVERERAARATFETLVHSARLINSQTDLTAVLQTIVTKVVEIIKRPVCSVGLVDETGSALFGRANVGMSPEVASMTLQVGRGFLGGVVASGTKWQIYDLPESEFRDASAVVKEGWRSAIALPLKYNEQTIGVLCVYDFKPGHFSEDEVALLEGMAEQACIAIHNATTFEEMRRQRDKYQALMENSTGGVFLLLPATARILEVNLNASVMSGYSPAELVGRKMSELLIEKERKGLDQLLHRLIARKIEAINIKDSILQCSNGTTRLVTISARLVDIGDSQIIMVVVRDITEQRAMEQELIRVEQLRALGQLASGVAHDFNNVLTGILGLSELLLVDIDDTSEQRRLIEVIRQSALDGAHMVRRIQFLGTKRETEDYANIDVTQLIQDVIEFTRPRWRNETRQRGASVELVFEPEVVPPVWGSASELREVLTNLIFNALDAMPVGGLLTFRNYFKADQVYISVNDTGSGMSEATKQHLFEPFYTTKQKEGHGLGLSVSWGIINRHGGSIEVQSRLNEGTEFIIKLPAASPAKQLIEQFPAASAETTQRSSLRSLIVDDEPNLVYVLTRILENLGHSVTAVLSGSEALAVLSANPNSFDIMFTDLSIPDMVGWEIARAARQLQPDLAIVLVTGWGADLDQQMVADYQIDLVINKPYRVRDIQVALATLAEQGRLGDR